MNAGRIGTNDPIGYEAGKAQRKKATVQPLAGFTETVQAMQDNRKEAGAENSGEKPVFRWLYSENGSKGEVLKAHGDTPEHPVYNVRTWDRAGNTAEQRIEVSGVDPQNCNTYEMYAYTAHLKETEKGSFEETVLKTAIAKAASDLEQKTSGSWDFSKDVNWVETVKDILQSAYSYGDLKGYLEWKKFLGFLEQ